MRRHPRLTTAVDDLAHVALRGAQLAQGVCAPQHPASGSVGDEAPTAAIEQRRRQAFLESDQALAQRGLAHVQVPGGGRQRLVAADSIEELEVAYVDIHNVSYRCIKELVVVLCIGLPYRGRRPEKPPRSPS